MTVTAPFTWQLSVAKASVTKSGTVAIQAASTAIVGFGGQVISGGVTSVITTSKAQLATLPAASATSILTVTDVGPVTSTTPGLGVCVTVNPPVGTGQLSVAVTRLR